MEETGRCDNRHTAASTFKVALALIGYDAGVLVDAHTPLWTWQPGMLAPTRDKNLSIPVSGKPTLSSGIRGKLPGAWALNVFQHTSRPLITATWTSPANWEKTTDCHTRGSRPWQSRLANRQPSFAVCWPISCQSPRPLTTERWKSCQNSARGLAGAFMARRAVVGHTTRADESIATSQTDGLLAGLNARAVQSCLRGLEPAMSKVAKACSNRKRC